MKSKLCTAAEAVEKHVRPGSTVVVSGYMESGVANETLQALRDAYDGKSEPSDLTVIAGNTPAIDILAVPGLVKRVVAGSYLFSSKMAALVAADEVEGYNLPQGVIAQLFREVCNMNGGLATGIGTGTFADPRISGGKMNASARDDIVQIRNILGQDLLYYISPKIDVTIIRATSVDEQGNVTFDDEPAYSFAVEAAIAAKTCGGKVIVECRDYVKAGTLSAVDVRLAHIFVDAVVQVQDFNASYRISRISGFNRAVLGQSKLAINPGKVLEPSPVKAIARRAAEELEAGCAAFVGAGIARHVSDVVAEEGCAELVTLCSESGSNGGVMQDGEPFGIEVNHTSLLDEPTQYDFLHSGAVGTAFITVFQADASGKVNCSRLGGKIAGCGPAIDVVYGARKIVLLAEPGGGGVLVGEVEEATFDGALAVSEGKRVVLITENAVFELLEDGWTIVETAPDASPDAVLGNVPFKIPVSAEVSTMDKAIFDDALLGLADRLV